MKKWCSKNWFKYLQLYFEKNTTLNKVSKEINLDGQKLVGNFFKNMQNVGICLANKLSTDNKTWKPTRFSYDDNIYDDQGPQPFNETIATKNGTNNWTIEMKSFFKWLNSEQ